MIQKNQKAGQSVQIDTRLARVFRMKKGVMTTARLVNDRLKSEKIRWVPIMVTLTYRDADAWKPNHITDFIRRVQMYAKRRGYTFPNVWVMELQKRGAPHYHVLFWIPARLRLHRPDSQGWWVFGSSNVTRVRNAVGYVAKYASKFESKDAQFPHGARIHGIGGITKLEKRIVAWWKLPKSLRTGSEGSVVWRRAIGGGWQNPETGDFVLPQWKATPSGDGLVKLDADTRTMYDKTWATYWKSTKALDVAEMRKYTGAAYPLSELSLPVDISQAEQWAMDYRRRHHLASLQEINPAHYWQFFDCVERGYLPSVANPGR